MKHFCCLISLQAGCTVIAVVFVTLAVVVFLVNLPHLIVNTFFLVMFAWIIFMVCVAITSFMAAYLESPGVAVFTLFILAVTIIYWLCISILPIVSTDYRWISNLCLNQRCGESLWLMGLNYHALNYSDPTKSHFMRGDLFSNQSYFSNIRGNSNQTDKETDKIYSSINLRNSSVRNFTHSFENLSDLVNSKLDHALNSHEDEAELKGDIMDREGWKEEKKSSKQAAVNHDQSYLNYPSFARNTSKDSQLTLTDVDYLLSDKDPVVISNEHEVLEYYDYLKSDKGDSEPAIVTSKTGFKVISTIVLLINLIFFIYCWIVMYSFWRTVSKRVHDVYRSSDFDDAETSSEATTK